MEYLLELELLATKHESEKISIRKDLGKPILFPPLRIIIINMPLKESILVL